MPLLTWALSSAGYGDAASYIANFRFKAHSGLIEGPHGFNHNDGYENLPCSSFAWPVIGVFSYLVFIFIGTRYDRWARRRVENLLQKESHPQQRYLIAAVNVRFIPEAKFSEIVKASHGKEADAKAIKLELKQQQQWSPWRRVLDLACGYHNYFLSVASLVMLIGAIVAMVEDMQNEGFVEVYCDQRKGEIVFWSYMFYVSKYYEFLDTFFLVVRSGAENLQFLHVVHHCIVPFLFWLYLEVEFTGQWVQVILNLGVHVLMYYYFGFVVLNPGVQVWWRKYITKMQIFQFLSDMGGTIPWFFLEACRQRIAETPDVEYYFGFGYGTGILFCILFGRIHYATKRAAAKKTAAAKASSKTD